MRSVWLAALERKKEVDRQGIELAHIDEAVKEAERRGRELARARKERRARRSLMISSSSLCCAMRAIIAPSASSDRCGHTRRMGGVKSCMISWSRVVLLPVGSRTICMLPLASVGHGTRTRGR